MPHLTAVGLGPGDPELITLKGLRAIQDAQFVFVPRSRDGSQSLALRIAEPHLDHTRQQVVELPLPMTRNSDELVPACQGAADVIGQILQPEGGRGVYLLLGDPLLYGTFCYIWWQIQKHWPNIAVEIVPGVTSFAATAALTQTVLSTTDDRVAIIPATYETDTAKLKQLLNDFKTVILMKVGPVLPQIMTALRELGQLEHTLYAERVGMPEQFIATGPELTQLEGQRQPYLSLLIVSGSN